MCLADANLPVDAIDYINAHGTGTVANDITEIEVIKAVFGDEAKRLSVSSTKSTHGHALGASGSLELVAVIEAVRRGIVPPTINIEELDPECDLDVTPGCAWARPATVCRTVRCRSRWALNQFVLIFPGRACRTCIIFGHSPTVVHMHIPCTQGLAR
jgi:3-oxoacyl-(acyl-carrier-protein) synthase